MNTPEIIGLLGLAVSVLGLIIAIIREWSYVVSAARALKQKVISIPYPSVSRRAFLMCSAALGGAITLYIFRRKIFILNLFRKLTWITLPIDLVRNTNSGILHHAVACKNHLPGDGNRSNSYAIFEISHVHKGQVVHIAQLVAKKASGSEVEELLIKAIEVSPTSTHLYKFLIKIWGKKKEYERIHEFLSVNIAYLESKVTEQNKMSIKLLKRYTKAVSELKQRKARAEYLARMAQLSKT